ncbi:MAG: hypothetical protein Kow0065_18220 [Methylomicrobium sp.]
MSGRIDFTMRFGKHDAPFGQKRSDQNGYRIYLIGDFSGRSVSFSDSCKIRSIDIDNFDRVFADVGPVLAMDSGDGLHFASIDEFHPDAWFKKIPMLSDLLQLKKELQDPRTAAQAAAKIGAFGRAEAEHGREQPAEATENRDAMFERLLGKKSEPRPIEVDTVDKLIAQVVAPHIVKPIEPEQRALIEVVDATLSQLLRALLHRPDFQALEALWRAADSLINNEEASDEQQFFLVDVGRQALLDDLERNSQAFKQKLLDHLQTGDREQEVLLIGDYRFSESAEDATLLRFFGDLAKAGQGCFLGSAGGSLIDTLHSGQSAFRVRYLEGVDTERVILAFPRYLARLPYGEKREPIESLAFEECAEIPERHELLWGNPAFLCARTLIRGRAGYNNEDSVFIGDIPVFSFVQDGETVLQPSTERVLSETQFDALLSQGITPVMGFRQRQGARIPVITTLAGVD